MADKKQLAVDSTTPAESIEMQPVPKSEVAGKIDKDDERATEIKAKFGHELYTQTRTRRLFSFAQLFAFSLTYMSVWEGISINCYFALYNGGPQTFLFSYIITFFGVISQAASIGEMASIQPVAGAQYHWTFLLAPEEWKRFATWIQGWVTWFGYIATLAGISNWAILQLESVIQLNYPDTYVPGGWHTTVLVIAMNLSQCLLNVYAFKVIPWIELCAGVLHVLQFVVFLSVLTAMGTRHDPSFLLSTNYESSGWNNHFISWNVGMLSCVGSLTAFDSALHMGEETKHAKKAVPRSMFWSIFTNGILGLVMVFVLLISMGPVSGILDSTVPITTIVYNATGSVPATSAMMSGMFITSFCSNMSSLASVSRLTWAWARDGGMPKYLAFVSGRHRVPVRSVAVTTFLICALCLLNLNSASYIAFGAILALSSLGLYSSYAIAISCMLYSRFSSRSRVELGEWNWGKWGPYINVFALVYTLWALVFLPFPSTLPVTAENMNYAGPIMGLVLVMALTVWFLRAQKHWPGPNLAVVELVTNWT